MHTEPIQILSYSDPLDRPRRYQHLVSIFPFGAGLLVGGMLAAGMIITAPDFFSATLWPPALIVAIVISATVSFFILLLIGGFSATPRLAQSWQTSISIGIAVPVLGTFAALAAGVVQTLTSPPQWLDNFAGCLMLGYLSVLGMGPAFLLVRWRGTLPTPEVQQKQARSIFIKAGIAAGLLVISLAIGRWVAQSAFDQKCQTVAFWVKSTRPKAGAYVDLILPKSLIALSANGKVDAVVTSDNRVILVLKSERTFHDNWMGVIYSTGSIAPSEIGPDGWGRTMISIKGLPYHFISRRRDSQHFDVGSDLD